MELCITVQIWGGCLDGRRVLLNASANGGGCGSLPDAFGAFVEMDGGASRRRQDGMQSKARRNKLRKDPEEKWGINDVDHDAMADGRFVHHQHELHIIHVSSEGN